MSDENEKQPYKEPDAGKPKLYASNVGSDEAERKAVPAEDTKLPLVATELIKKHIENYEKAFDMLNSKRETLLTELESTYELISQARGAIEALKGVLE